MTPAFAATLALLGFAGAFVSGLVGVGGAIVMIPLLYYVPPLLGELVMRFPTEMADPVEQLAVYARTLQLSQEEAPALAALERVRSSVPPFGNAAKPILS